MESAVPREIIDPCGCFEEDDGRASWFRFAFRNLLCHLGDLQIIEPADKSAFEALGEKIFEHIRRGNLYDHQITAMDNFPKTLVD